MCGIAGILHFDRDREIDREVLNKMTSVIQHRGPDGEGFFVSERIGLGHRRLSIIDLNTGDQPILNDDGSVVLVFNGEIYNYLELRKELQSRGHRFRTESDSEVIIRAYEEWGYDCQDKFNGMWAFALWDKNREQLFLSRDRIGEKPLFYSVFDNTLVFASEIKSLFAYGVPRENDLSLVEIYLTMTNVPEPFTFFRNIKKLQAGHYIVVKGDKLIQTKYWDLPLIDEENMITDKSYVYTGFRDLFTDSVRLRMRSDVPYGAFLSGGLDSSSVVATMSKVSKFPVKTFTIGFPDRSFDESLLAQKVSEKFETLHYRGSVEPDDFESILDSAHFHYDEPFGDSSAIPTGYVSKFAREHVKMVLTGDGGDEVLSGYNSYVGIKISDLYNTLPSFLKNSIPGTTHSIKRFTKGGLRLKLNRVESVSRTARMSFNERMLEKRSYAPLKQIKELTRELKGVYKVDEFFNDFMSKCPYNDDFYKLMYLNFKYDLPNDYLVKVDRMSMAHSLETRLPFLDHNLIEFMVQVDKSVKMQGWERKSVLRNTIGQDLPADLLKAPKKGFGIPLREWFKKEDFSSILNENLKCVRSLLDTNVIDSIIRDNKISISDHGNFIWTLLMLDKNLK